jgi:hypothetical protein
MSDEIIVYWAPGAFSNFDQSWDMLYSEPVSVLAKLMSDKLPGAGIAQCPATKSLLKNVFALTSNIDDEFDFFPKGVSNLNPSLGESKVLFSKPRESSFSGYVNATYNLSWLFFASEPVNMRLTAPFFPAVGICEGSLFSPGTMDVGSWYRQVNLDWHVPETTERISIQEGQELAYVEFETTKKITFQRYVTTPRLMHIANELAQSHIRYGKHWPLKKKYDLAKKAGMRELILAEIEKNKL